MYNDKTGSWIAVKDRSNRFGARKMVLDRQQLLRNLLFDYFVRSQSRNPRFSIRAFAKKLGVSSSEVSELLRGKRKISRAKALEYAKKLRFTPATIGGIERAFSSEGRLESLKTVTNPLKEILVGTEHFGLLADWLCFALVALMRTEGFKDDVTWMAARLEVKKEAVERALDRLIEAGVVSRTETGAFRAEPVCFRGTDEFPNELDSRRQIDGLRNAIARIEAKDRLRVGSYSTVSADISKLPEAEKLIEDFLKRLSLFLAEGKKTEVLELQIQLFPLTRPEGP